jgi:hypothetical protein
LVDVAREWIAQTVHRGAEQRLLVAKVPVNRFFAHSGITSNAIKTDRIET